MVWHLDSDLDILDMVWTTPMGPRNPTNINSQTLLVLLTMLSHNHQNHNYGLMGYTSKSARKLRGLSLHAN
jgi:metal-dependent hydrolase (beta-lactamase superfamily II)